MSEVSVRDAVAADAPEIVRLLDEMKAHHRAFESDEPRFDVPEDDLAAFAGEILADPGVSVLVAEGPNRLLGFVQSRYLPKSWGRSCEVDLLGVDERARGSGIGTALMREVEGRARAAGVVGMRLNVTLGNEGALRLYERLGYSQSAVRLAKPLSPE